MANFIQSVADALFMPYVVGVLLGGGLFLTIRLGFVQLRRLPEALRTMLSAQSAGATGALSPFQAFMTALGASIGTGNIAGVATAIISGGPGALFWIWVYGFVATAIKFSEAVLGVRFRNGRHHIEIQRIARRARLFRPIEHGHTPDGRGQRRQKRVARERSIQPHFKKPNLLAARRQYVRRLVRRLRA